MFQLIVTIIAIALIVLLAIASIFYGGTAFTASSAKATEAALVNGGEQIAGAQILYMNDEAGNAALTVYQLTQPGPYGLTYLSAVPSTPLGLPTGAAWTMNSTGSVAYIEVSGGTTSSAFLPCVRVATDNATGAATALESFSAATGPQLPNLEFACATDGTNLYFGFKL